MNPAPLLRAGQAVAHHSGWVVSLAKLMLFVVFVAAVATRLGTGVPGLPSATEECPAPTEAGYASATAQVMPYQVETAAEFSAEPVAEAVPAGLWSLGEETAGLLEQLKKMAGEAAKESAKDTLLYLAKAAFNLAVDVTYRLIDKILSMAGIEPPALSNGGNIAPMAPGQMPSGPQGMAAQAAAAAGFTGADLTTAVAIAGAESGFRPTVTNRNRNGSVDHGLWQINSVHGPLLRSGDWRDPYANARMAKAVFDRAGGSWSPWTTYKTGAYLAVDVQPIPPAGPMGCATPAVLASAACPVSTAHLGTERGLQSRATTVLRCGVAAFPEVGDTLGRGSRGNASLHPSGEAVDFMIPNYQSPQGRAYGDRLASWMWANRHTLGVTEVIWRDRIITAARASEGWRPYGHPSGSRDDTPAHRDHVHVSAPDRSVL